MKKIIILLTGIACLGNACGKKKASPVTVSEWKFGAESFTTTNVSVSAGRGGTYLSSTDVVRFSIYFCQENHLPVAEQLPLARQANTPGTAQIMVSADTYSYQPSVHTSPRLQAREVNGKARYTLAPTWFVNTRNSNDSVLVAGNFNEP